jgi:flagellar biosynthesis protein
MSQYDDVMNKKAVALRYDENKDVAPVIVASGLGYMAERIVEMANENGVPVYEDNSLATVLTQLDLGTAIPEELYQAIVDIYAYFLRYNPEKIREKKEAEEAAARAAAEAEEAEKEAEEAAAEAEAEEAAKTAGRQSARGTREARPKAAGAARVSGAGQARAKKSSTRGEGSRGRASR